MGKLLSNIVQKATDSVKSVSTAVQRTAEDAAANIKKIKIPDIKHQNQQPTTESMQIKPGQTGYIATENALMIIYYLMAADGTVFHNEEEKFDAIGVELDPEFAQKKENVIKKCKGRMDKLIDGDDYFDVLRDAVEDALMLTEKSDECFITPKLLVWDMLTVAYSDENYDETERRLIKYAVRKLEIDRAVFLEMESSMLTLIDVERELNWIKTTNQPYLVIEARVNELSKRKDVIFDSIKDLIKL